jgi:hypothetical protein
MSRGPHSLIPEVRPKPSTASGTGRLTDASPRRATEADWTISDAGPKNKALDLMVTVCSVCGLGIFKGQAREWSQNPLGLVHTECV